MNKKILVIDDEEVIRKSFLLALEDTEYEVDLAISGFNGIEKVKNQKYDLIFMDLKMPQMNGVETLIEINKIDPDPIVYFVTAFYGEFFDELEALCKQGINFEILRKPIGMDDIVSITKSILSGPSVQ